MKRHFTRCCLLALLSLAACEKAEPDELGLTYVNGVPYYYFTPNDRL